MKKSILLLSLFIGLGQSLFAQNYQVTAIGFYNFENLFDTVQSVDVLNTAAFNSGVYPYMQTIPRSTVNLDEATVWGVKELTEWVENEDREDVGIIHMDKRDDDFTADGSYGNNSNVYYEKLDKLAKVVSELGTNITPDGVAILGVAEIEQRSVLEDFVKREAVAGRNYQIVHHNSMDFRGIDVALIYQPKYFEVEHYKVLQVKLEHDKAPRYFTRDILWVEGILNGEKVHILVNHWPSRSGGEAASAHNRAAAAQVAVGLIDSLKEEDENVKIVVMGDFNDDPSSPSIAKILQADGKKEAVSKYGMFNPFALKHKKGLGTGAWRDAWSLFDQIIVSPGLLQEDGVFYYKAEIFNKPWMIQQTGLYRGYPFRSFISGRFTGGYSDHFPVVIYLVKEVD